MPGPLLPSPGSFPGVSQLPPLVQQLIERVFPPEQLPMSAGSLIYRGPGDISRVLGAKPSVLPDVVPRTMQNVNSAVSDYAQKVAQILQQLQTSSKK